MTATIAAVTALIVAIGGVLGTVFGIVKALKAGSSAAAAHTRINAMIIKNGQTPPTPPTS